MPLFNLKAARTKYFLNVCYPLEGIDGHEWIKSSTYLSRSMILAASGALCLCSLAILNITKLAISGDGLSPNVTRRRM